MPSNLTNPRWPASRRSSWPSSVSVPSSPTTNTHKGARTTGLPRLSYSFIRCIASLAHMPILLVLQKRSYQPVLLTCHPRVTNCSPPGVHRQLETSQTRYVSFFVCAGVSLFCPLIQWQIFHFRTTAASSSHVGATPTTTPGEQNMNAFFGALTQMVPTLTTKFLPENRVLHNPDPTPGPDVPRVGQARACGPCVRTGPQGPTGGMYVSVIGRMGCGCACGSLREGLFLMQ